MIYVIKDNDVLVKNDPNGVVLSHIEKEKLVSMLSRLYLEKSTVNVLRSYIFCDVCGRMITDDNKYIGRPVTKCLIVLEYNEKKYIFNSLALHFIEEHDFTITEEHYNDLHDLLN